MKYNDQGIINLMGAIIEQAENDIKKPWGVSGYSIAEDTRNALDAIHFFSSDWYKKLSMGSDLYILKRVGLSDLEFIRRCFE